MMRYAAEFKTNAEPLAAFVQRKGGINKCAEDLPDASGDTVETEGAPDEHQPWGCGYVAIDRSSTARGQTNVTWSFRNLLGSGVDRGENRFPCRNERKLQESLRHGQRLP